MLTEFLVVGPSAAMNPALAEPATALLRFKMTRNKEPCRAILHLSSTAPVTPGEFLPFHVRLENNTSKKISKVHAYIAVTVSATAQGHHQTVIHRLAEADLEVTLQPGDTHEGNYRIR